MDREDPVQPGDLEDLGDVLVGADEGERAAGGAEALDAPDEDAEGGGVDEGGVGEVDLYTAPEFKERMVELIESGKKQIVVDLSKATFIDSTTLGVLVGGVKRLRPAGGSLALVCTDENITKIFEITGLDRVFPIHSSREEALDAVSSGATD